jgi:hypothetical protein
MFLNIPVVFIRSGTKITLSIVTGPVQDRIRSQMRELVNFWQHKKLMIEIGLHAERKRSK